MDKFDIVTTLRRESFYRPTSRLNSNGKVQMGFELMSINLQAADEIERLRAELDEARRDLCMLIVRGNAGYGFEGSMRDVAKERGWDCFKENTDD